jgi:hypothetical protein
MKKLRQTPQLLSFVHGQMVPLSAALKQIGRYLKGTRDKGLIMRPSHHLHVDCYPDADLAGLYNNEDAQRPTLHS